MSTLNFPTLVRLLRGAFSVGVFACAANANAGGLNDAQIIGIYIQVNGFDIETALLGKGQANSDDVRKLAEHVASDHLGVRQAAYALAATCKVSPVLPTERDKDAIDHGTNLAKLLALKGPAFDSAYIQHEIAFHTGAIDAVKNVLLPAAKCPELQAHFKMILPAFEHHVMHTKALAKN